MLTCALIGSEAIYHWWRWITANNRYPHSIATKTIHAIMRPLTMSGIMQLNAKLYFHHLRVRRCKRANAVYPFAYSWLLSTRMESKLSMAPARGDIAEILRIRCLLFDVRIRLDLGRATFDCLATCDSHHALRSTHQVNTNSQLESNKIPIIFKSIWLQNNVILWKSLSVLTHRNLLGTWYCRND